MSSHTLTWLRRWSCEFRQLPDISKIRCLHVYDFDNTLFNTPLPNRRIWDQRSGGRLMEESVFSGGGWWHDPSILRALGEGEEKEAERQWAGFWNEDIVELVNMSMKQEDAVTVLLTGRGEGRFSELIKRMVHSKGLSFDLTCLKPRVGPADQQFSSTMLFKQAFLTDLMMTYHQANEIRLYDDRPRHVEKFRDWLAEFNSKLSHAPPKAPFRQPLNSKVIHVPSTETNLDPVTEIAEIQRMVNEHNASTSHDKPSPSNHVTYTIRPSINTRGPNYQTLTIEADSKSNPNPAPSRPASYHPANSNNNNKRRRPAIDDNDDYPPPHNGRPPPRYPQNSNRGPNQRPRTNEHHNSNNNSFEKRDRGPPPRNAVNVPHGPGRGGGGGGGANGGGGRGGRGGNRNGPRNGGGGGGGGRGRGRPGGGGGPGGGHSYRSLDDVGDSRGYGPGPNYGDGGQNGSAGLPYGS